MAGHNPITLVSSIITKVLVVLYSILQSIIVYIFSPAPPRYNDPLAGPRIAIIGAGLTGVSAAAHCVSHGSDVVLFESTSEIGGIWSRVNTTSGLQIHSIMYRFHPAVNYAGGYPKRDNIVSEIKKVWQMYGLEPKTRFNTSVSTVRWEKNGWIINEDRSFGMFDGIIAAVGTCGDPKMPHITGVENFQGKVVHSSQLDGVDMKDKEVCVIGGGASAVEALEYAAANGAKTVNLLSRTDKWIIPRNPVIDILLSLNVFGAETYSSYIPEYFLRRFFYRDLSDLAPKNEGLWESTPMVNDKVLEQIRSGEAKWLRGDIKHIAWDGIVYNLRESGVPQGGPGKETFVPCSVIVYATGFSRPSLDFLPSDCFDAPYEPPNWYLQTFPPSHVDICANNCTYVNAIGTVGHFHIGIYTRLLLMFLTDPLTRPPENAMKFWVRFTTALKRRAPTRAFDFFTYGELCWWFLECVVVNPFRWKWALFVAFGWAKPGWVVDGEKRFGTGKLKAGPW